MRTNLFAATALALMMAGCAKNEVREAGSSSSNVINFKMTTTRATIVDTDAMEADATGIRVYATSGSSPAGWYDGLNGGSNYYVHDGTNWGWAVSDAYWPVVSAGYPMEFYAWFPAAPTGLVVGANDATVPELDFAFTVQSTAATQTDLVVAKANVPNLAAKPNGSGLNLTFKHILAKVNFTITVADGYDAYVQSLRVVNLNNTGTYDMIASAWDFSTPTNNTFYTYYSAPATKIEGDDTPQAFAPAENLMLMPQNPTVWDLSALPVAGEAYIEMTYRMEDTDGGDPDFVGSSAGTGLFVKVAFPYIAKWVEGYGYTYNILLDPASTTGGYLISDYYCSNSGAPTSTPVMEYPLLAPIFMSTADVIVLNPTVSPWNNIYNNIIVDNEDPYNTTLVNTTAPFATTGALISMYGTEEVYLAEGWSVTPNIATIGNVRNDNSTVNYHLGFLGGGSYPVVTNGKIWQTLKLEAGNYRFSITKNGSGDISASDIYAVAALGSALPDISNIGTALDSYKYPTYNSSYANTADVDFTLTEGGLVSLGFVISTSYSALRISSMSLTKL